MIAIITSWVGATVVRYVVLGLIGGALGLGGLAWVRYEARAPYETQIDQLKKAITIRDDAAEHDAMLKDAQASQAQELQNELDAITAQASSCKLSADELGRLRKLAGAAKH